MVLSKFCTRLSCSTPPLYANGTDFLYERKLDVFVPGCKLITGSEWIIKRLIQRQCDAFEGGRWWWWWWWWRGGSLLTVSLKSCTGEPVILRRKEGAAACALVGVRLSQRLGGFDIKETDGEERVQCFGAEIRHNPLVLTPNRIQASTHTPDPGLHGWTEGHRNPN